MKYLSVIILSITQAITEFVPISSSGHLIILHNILPSLTIDEMAFDVFLHLGTLSSIVIFFWSDIKRLTWAFCQNLIGGRPDVDSRLAWFIIWATIPAAGFGYFFDDFIDQHFRSPLIVALMLVAVGILFLWLEHFSKQTDTLKSMNKKTALNIGWAQVLALIPGTSRSGITIAAGLAMNLRREDATRFSFLLSLPIVMAANIKKIISISEMIANGGLFIFLLSFLIAFVSGYFVIKYLMIFVQHHSLKIFAYYRFALAVVILFSYYLHFLG